MSILKKRQERRRELLHLSGGACVPISRSPTQELVYARLRETAFAPAKGERLRASLRPLKSFLHSNARFLSIAEELYYVIRASEQCAVPAEAATVVATALRLRFPDGCYGRFHTPTDLSLVGLEITGYDLDAKGEHPRRRMPLRVESEGVLDFADAADRSVRSAQHRPRRAASSAAHAEFRSVRNLT